VFAVVRFADYIPLVNLLSPFLDMDVTGEPIRRLLQELLQGSINEAQLNKLVQISRTICQAHQL
jgi:hypothetical protein